MEVNHHITICSIHPESEIDPLLVPYNFPSPLSPIFLSNLLPTYSYTSI